MDDSDIPQFPRRIAAKLKSIREHFKLKADQLAPLVGAKNGAEIEAYERDLGLALMGGILITTLFRYVKLAGCEIEDILDDEREVAFTSEK